MKKKLLLVFVLFIAHQQVFSQPNKLAKFAVRFGEHTRRMPVAAANVARIFMDKDGNYYPDVFINDKALKKSNNSLTEWYRNNTEAFAAICNKYGVPGGVFESRLTRLNDAIANSVVTEINKKSKGCDIINVYVHGFSKKAYGFRLVDRRSTGDNRKLEKAMMAKRGEKIFFIEVYWDAAFIGVIKGAHKAKGYYVYKEQGIPNALHAGLGLRKVITNIEAAQLNIITHSLGAVVACELLFDADTANPGTQAALPTPAQHIKACLIAPALGAGMFGNYFLRAGNRVAAQDDKYRLSVVYNKNDFILNKNLSFLFFKIMNHSAEGIVPTTLGCDYHNDLQLLQSIVAPCTVRTFDLSYKHGHARKCHYLNHCYIHNKARFSEVVSYLEE